MRLATLRIDGTTAAARQDGDSWTLLDAPDVGAYLASGGAELGSVVDPSFAPVVPAPRHVFCAGLNYRSHIQEMGRELPEYPTLFAKFASALLGPYDDLVLPAESAQVDWEAELAVVVGRPVRRVTPEDAVGAIAGFTVANDVSLRDWQRRTPQWLQGKTWERTTPFGPVLVTPDELGDGTGLAISCEVDGVPRQRGNTADLLFSPAELVSYVSTLVTLQAGDVVLTGTPGGVGAGGGGTEGLRPGTTMTTTVEGIGACVNRCVA